MLSISRRKWAKGRKKKLKISVSIMRNLRRRFKKWLRNFCRRLRLLQRRVRKLLVKAWMSLPSLTLTTKRQAFHRRNKRLLKRSFSRPRKKSRNSMSLSNLRARNLKKSSSLILMNLLMKRANRSSTLKNLYWRSMREPRLTTRQGLPRLRPRVLRLRTVKCNLTVRANLRKKPRLCWRCLN